MRVRITVAAAGLAAIVPCLAAPAAQDEPRCSRETFLEFRAAVDHARKLDEVLPLLARTTRKLQDADSSQDRAINLALLKQVSEQKDPEVTSVEALFGACRVELTATAPDGRPQRGLYKFMNERGSWRLQAWGWSDQDE